MAEDGIGITLPSETTKPQPLAEARTALRRFLLTCGIVSSMLYVAMNVIVPMQWDGYSFASQVISELSAVDAPTRRLWVPLGIIYTLLTIAFGCGVWASARGNRHLRVVGVLTVVNGVIGLAWPPMHQRAVLAAGGATLTDTLHIVWSMTWVVLMMLAIGLGAAAFGKRFRRYSIATMLILVAFGVLTGLDGPRISANLPTPLVGVWERINIGVGMLWVVVLATVLLRTLQKTRTGGLCQGGAAPDGVPQSGQC